MRRDLVEGTYGWDKFSKFLLIMSIPFFFGGSTFLIGGGIAGFAVYRRMSKNIYKRQKEEMAFENYMRNLNYRLYNLKQRNVFKSLTNKFHNLSYRIEQRKDYVVFKCPNCKQKLRLPRHKGNLVVTCKKCSHKFEKRT